MAYFEKAKTELLSTALSETTQWKPVPNRVDDLAELVVLLAPIVPHSDPPTEAQTYFWVTLEAYREYMKTGKQHSDREVSRQLTLEMVTQFYLFVMDALDIDAEVKARLSKKVKALSIIARERLNEAHPRRPLITIAQAAGVCGVCEKTIRRWEAGKSTPLWYPGRYVTTDELIQRAKFGLDQKIRARIEAENRKMVSYRDGFQGR